MSKSREAETSLGLEEFIEKKFRQRPLVIGFAVMISCFSSGFGAHAALVRSPGIDRVLMIHDCPADVTALQTK